MTVVTRLRLGTFHYCGPHNQDAWLKAISIAATEGKCGVLFPPVVILRSSATNQSRKLPLGQPQYNPGLTLFRSGLTRAPRDPEIAGHGSSRVTRRTARRSHGTLAVMAPETHTPCGSCHPRR